MSYLGTIDLSVPLGRGIVIERLRADRSKGPGPSQGLLFGADHPWSGPGLGLPSRAFRARPSTATRSGSDAASAVTTVGAA